MKIIWHGSMRASPVHRRWCSPDSRLRPSPGRLWLVTDADDPASASELLELRWRL
jgi:hypothetical protein